MGEPASDVLPQLPAVAMLAKPKVEVATATIIILLVVFMFLISSIQWSIYSKQTSPNNVC